MIFQTTEVLRPRNPSEANAARQLLPVDTTPEGTLLSSLPTTMAAILDKVKAPFSVRRNICSYTAVRPGRRGRRAVARAPGGLPKNPASPRKRTLGLTIFSLPPALPLAPLPLDPLNIVIDRRQPADHGRRRRRPALGRPADRAEEGQRECVPGQRHPRRLKAKGVATPKSLLPPPTNPSQPFALGNQPCWRAQCAQPSPPWGATPPP